MSSLWSVYVSLKHYMRWTNIHTENKVERTRTWMYHHIYTLTGPWHPNEDWHTHWGPWYTSMEWHTHWGPWYTSMEWHTHWGPWYTPMEWHTQWGVYESMAGFGVSTLHVSFANTPSLASEGFIGGRYPVLLGFDGTLVRKLQKIGKV